MTNGTSWMLPALCPHPLPHNNLSKPTLSMDTGCSKDTVFNLHPHTQPLISKPHLCSRESWPGGVFTSATHRSYPQPRCLWSSLLFSAPGPHLGCMSLVFGHPWQGFSGHPMSNQWTPQKILSFVYLQVLSFPFLFLSPLLFFLFLSMSHLVLQLCISTFFKYINFFNVCCLSSILSFYFNFLYVSLK